MVGTHARTLACALILIAHIRCCGGGGGGGGGLGSVVCARTPGLAERQRALCRAHPALIPHIADGLRMAYAGCRAALRGRRWNCSGVGDENHFAHYMPIGSREAAFTYALTSAGVTHALSAACARGDLPACGCTHRGRGASGGSGGGGAGGGGAGWQWAGGGRCGAAAYGGRMARRFLDARELERDARALMNLHNNRLGRKVVKELVRRECKCHGVSGSCAVRTCWRALPHYTQVLQLLLNKYNKAKQVVAIERGTTLDGRVNTQLYVKRGGDGGVGRAARRSELVYLEASPSYCEPDATRGSHGTHHRHCNATSRAEDSCATLCCGRGYTAHRVTVRQQCRCVFHWCCRVACDTCLTQHTTHICN